VNQSEVTQASPHYRVLDEAQIRQLHTATLELLETVGIRVLHPEALQLLRNAGALVKGEDIALIPGTLVEDGIRSAPKHVAIYNRLGEPAMHLEGRNIHYGLGTDLINAVDLDTGETRPSRLSDVERAARVADACQEIDFIGSFALPHDVPTNTVYIEGFKAQLENSIKPIFFTAGEAKDLAYILQIAAVVAGGPAELRQKPFLVHYAEPTPPLTHSFGAVSKLFLCAERGIPICYTPAAMLGASAPVTLAGAIVQTTAEALSGVVLHQLRARGAPIISGIGVPSLDMRTSSISYAAPETRLGDSAMADLFHHYGLPVWATTGSDAHALDEQAAIEHTFGILTAALNGANLIHDVGYLGQGLLGNPAAIVMCNEIISYTKRILRGFSIDADTLALDAIRRSGPGGNYLADRHTLQHFRTELWQPQLLNRENPDAWERQGSEPLAVRAVRKTKAIIETHQPRPLDEALGRHLATLVAEARIALQDEQLVA
jgi:trimethylamine---corrinoid protein Co-methyltransferase